MRLQSRPSLGGLLCLRAPHQALSKKGSCDQTQPYCNRHLQLSRGVDSYAGNLQGYSSTSCDGDPDPPAPSCTATGGSFFHLRYTTSSGDVKSYGVFFAPSTEQWFAPFYNETLAATAASCAANTTISQDMESLAVCVAEATPDSRGVLAVAFGNGLRTMLQDVFFLNLVTEVCSDGSDYGSGNTCGEQPGVTVSIVALAPPPPAA